MKPTKDMNIIHESEDLTIEKIRRDIFIVRGYNAGRSEFPAGYTFVFTICVNDNGVAEFKGFIAKDGTAGPLKSQSLKIRKTLKSAGCKAIEYIRMKDGEDLSKMVVL